MLSPLAQVYSLAAFSEEVKAMAMAKCSRSANTFMEDAQAASDEQASAFHARVQSYGHESVADCAIGSLCFENISILAGEALVELQTGKYQGKSSRYVVYSRDRVVQPFRDLSAYAVSSEYCLDTSGRDAARRAYQIYNQGVAALFDAYESLYPEVFKWVAAQPEMEGTVLSVKRARALDALRGLLPLGALTNFGTRLSSRDTAELIRQFLASPHVELQQLAELMRGPAMEETPTLVRHAVLNPLYQSVKTILTTPLPPEACEGANVRLVKTWGDADDVIEMMNLEQTGAWIHIDPPGEGEVEDPDQDDIAAYMVTRTKRFDPVPHAYRAVRCRFGIEADFGVWKDLRRHRRCELFRAPFTAALGCSIPEDLAAIAHEGDSDPLTTYLDALSAATEAFIQLTELGFATEAQYLVAQGHTQRWVMDMDLEQLVYLVELRTQPGGHLGYRRVARQMYDLANAKFPELLTHVLVHPVDGVQAHH